MRKPKYAKRRRARRNARWAVNTDLTTITISQDELLAELEPNWFQKERPTDKVHDVDDAGKTRDAAA